MASRWPSNDLDKNDNRTVTLGACLYYTQTLVIFTPHFPTIGSALQKRNKNASNAAIKWVKPGFILGHFDITQYTLPEKS